MKALLKLLILLPIGVLAAVYNVNSLSAFQNALNNAAQSSEDDTIILKKATYNVSNTLTYTNPGNAGKLTIIGNGAILDANNNKIRILTISTSNQADDTNDDITIKQFTFQKGSGIKIFTNKANMYVNHNKFLFNTPINNGHYGGGIDAISEYGDIFIENNTFIQNDAPYGGAAEIDAKNGKAVIINNIFWNNSSNSRGGALNFYSNNEIYIINNTFYKNSAKGEGGGGVFIDLADQKTNIYNNIFWQNSAEQNEGDDIVIYGDQPLDIYNNVFSCSDFSGHGSCLKFVYSSNPPYNHANNFSQDPAFINADQGDFHLQATSPCIDSGDNNAPLRPARDFEGTIRPLDGDEDSQAIIDIGAFEFKSLVLDVPINMYGLLVLIFLYGFLARKYTKEAI